MGTMHFTEGHRRLARIALAIGASVVTLVWLTTADGEGPQLGLIPTLVAVAGAKFFGSKSDDPDAVGDHPSVVYMFSALKTGVTDDVEKMIAGDFEAYANGYLMSPPDSGDGAAQFRHNIEFWRSAVPDLSIDLYDEVSQKEPDKTDGIALRYVISGTLQAESGEVPFEVEVAAFIKVVDHMIHEWRVIVDDSFLEEARAKAGLSITK